MKGKKWKKLTGLKLVLGALAVSSLLCLYGLPVNNKASAVTVEGAGLSGWIGLGNANSANSNDYIWASDWSTAGMPISINPSTNWGVNNISGTNTIRITSEMTNSGGLKIQGAVRVGVYATNTNTGSFGKLPSNYTIFNANAFGLGIDNKIGVYDAIIDSATVKCYNNLTNASNGGQTARNYCDIEFSAHYETWNNVTGLFNLNWRLNGNGLTNQTGAAMWSGLAGYKQSNNSYIYTAQDLLTYSINIQPLNDNSNPQIDYTKQLESLSQDIRNLSGQQQETINAIENLNKQEQQNREDDKNAVEEQIKAGDDAQIDLSEQQKQGENWLKIITDLFDAKANGNCTLPKIEIYGLDFGEINLCYYEPPDWLSSVLSWIAGITTAWCAFKVVMRLTDVAKGFF